MSDPEEKLTPADPDELAAALAFALRFSGRKRAHDADTFMADIVAKRLVEHLERSRLKRSPPPAVLGLGVGLRGDHDFR